MTAQAIYPTTHQGVRDLSNPIRASRVAIGQPKEVESMPRRGMTSSDGDTRINVGPRERAASMLIGAVIVGYGLGRRDLAGLLIAALATGPICRGVVGHCAVYEAAGINTAR